MKKVVLITGASTGLGASIAAYLAGKAYTVYGTSRSATTNEAFTMLSLDVTNDGSVEQVVSQVLKQSGRIDVLINNAGLGIAGPVEELNLADVSRVFDTNVLGLLRMTQAVLPTMRAQRSGLVINISSIAAEAGLPFRGAYCATKAAVERLTETLRMEVAGFGIQACSVQPGGTRTDINKNRLRSTLPADSPYKKTFDHTYELIDQSVETGVDPAIFGPFIEKLMNTPHVARRYRVGKSLEKFSVLLKQLLPISIYERMIRNHYDMN